MESAGELLQNDAGGKVVQGALQGSCCVVGMWDGTYMQGTIDEIEMRWYRAGRSVT